MRIAEVLRAFGPEYRRRYAQALTLQQDRVLRELTACQTPLLGTHQWACDDCGATVTLPNSCGNRHCPTCGHARRAAWAVRVQSTILPVPYYHVILTVPQEITQLAFAHPRVLYPLVLRVGAAALLSCAGELFGAQLAVLVVLHTWGQLLNCHLHGHFLLPAGGLSLDGQCWIALSREEFQQLVKMLETVFRDLFLKQLRKAYDRGELTFSGDAPWRGLQRPEAFGQWLEPLSRIPWVVRCPRVWDRRALQDDPDGVTRTVHYLACYANRIAISNNRLLAIDGQDLWLRYKDYQDQNQWKTARMDGVEFVRRFLTHLLPRSMFHIRRYGFLGPRVQAQRIAQIRQLLAGADPDAEQPAAAGEEARDESPAEIEEPTKKCRSCGGKMFLSDRTPRPKVSEILRMPLHVFQQARTGIIITPGAKHTRDIASQKTETEKAETHPEQCSWAISAYW